MSKTKDHRKNRQSTDHTVKIVISDDLVHGRKPNEMEQSPASTDISD